MPAAHAVFARHKCSSDVSIPSLPPEISISRHPTLASGGTNMNNEPKVRFAELANHRGGIPTSKQQSSRRGPLLAVLAVSLWGVGVAAAQGDSPNQLRAFIDTQVGGIEKLMVPAARCGPAQRPASRWDRCQCRPHLHDDRGEALPWQAAVP